MFAGFLNEEVEIYDIVSSRNDYGEQVDDRAKVYSTRAKVGHAGGSRSVINNEIVTPYSKNFVLRIYVPVTDTSWIKYLGKFYRVVSIDVDKASQSQTIITELVNE